MPLYMEDVPIGSEFMLVENMDHGEVRWTVYRRADHPVRFPNNVAVVRLRCIQGRPGDFPRYDIVCRRETPSEVHGKTPVEVARPWPLAASLLAVDDPASQDREGEFAALAQRFLDFADSGAEFRYPPGALDELRRLFTQTMEAS